MDTRVFGGAFGTGFAEATTAVFAQGRRGRFGLAVSPLVLREREPAPAHVRDLFRNVLAFAEPAAITADALRLGQAYRARELPPRARDDALHVAAGTASHCRATVSWNFRQIVHAAKIPRYNEVNERCGLPPVSICPPSMVIAYEEDL